MSVIGPRPLLVEYLPYYTKEEHHRHDVRPGLSGWAQINGRNAIDSWEQRFQYDLEYVKNEVIGIMAKDVNLEYMKKKKNVKFYFIPSYDMRLDLSRTGRKVELRMHYSIVPT